METATKTVGGGDPKPAAAPGARRTRLVRVDQRIIDSLLTKTPNRPLHVFSDEDIDGLGMPGLREDQARLVELVKWSDDREADILHQYRTKGYAEVEEELTDGEEEVVVVVPPAKS